MAIVDYTRLAARATALIARFGTTATLFRKSSSGQVYDPNIVQTPHPIRIARTGYEEWNNESGGSIRKVEFYISAEDGVVPDDTDTITFDGVTYTLSNCQRLSPSGVDVYYKVLGSTT
jgi:hypothetical protein